MPRNSRKNHFSIRNFYLFEDEGGGSPAISNDGIASATLSMNTPSPAPAPAASPDFATLVPDEYKEKPYIQNILKSETPHVEFFKQFEGLQTKLGQRVSGIPGEGASEEEWANFHKAMGVPDSADGYEIKETEWSEEDKAIGEFIKESRGGEEFEKDVKAMFHELKIPPKTAQALIEKYDQLYLKHNKEFFQNAVAKTQEMEADFTKVSAQLFGNRADEVLENGKKLINSVVPENAKALLNTLDNNSLNVMAAVLDSIRTKYIKEDSITPGAGSSPALSKAEISEEGKKLMAHDAYRDPFHPEHERYKRLVKENYEKLKQFK